MSLQLHSSFLLSRLPSVTSRKSVTPVKGVDLQNAALALPGSAAAQMRQLRQGHSWAAHLKQHNEEIPSRKAVQVNF